MPGTAAQAITALVERKSGDQDPVDRLGTGPRAGPRAAPGSPATPGLSSLGDPRPRCSRNCRARHGPPAGRSPASPPHRPAPASARADLLGEGRDVEQHRLGPAQPGQVGEPSGQRRSPEPGDRSGSSAAIAARIARTPFASCERRSVGFGSMGWDIVEDEAPDEPERWSQRGSELRDARLSAQTRCP